MVLIATLLLLGLAILVFVVRRNNQGTEVHPSEEKTNAETSCASCTSHTDSCMHDCLMTKAVQAPEYFDDEELDAYKDRPSDSYTDEETAQFAEVLYTMQQEEVKDWLTSLSLRGINLPDQLKDEAIMLTEG